MSGPVIHREFAQHDPEWYAIRSGKWTASHAATIMSKIGDRGGLTLGLADLVKSIAFARVFGDADETRYQSDAMRRGNEMETEARDWYAFAADRAIEQVGFVEHARVPHVGWSPDGIDGRHGIEVKCLLHKAWMDAKRTRAVPAEYRWQCRWAMWVGELETLDFIAYHPKPGGLIIPCETTESDRDQMAERVSILEPKVHEWVDILTDKRIAA